MKITFTTFWLCTSLIKCATISSSGKYGGLEGSAHVFPSNGGSVFIPGCVSGSYCNSFSPEIIFKDSNGFQFKNVYSSDNPSPNVYEITGVPGFKINDVRSWVEEKIRSFGENLNPSPEFRVICRVNEYCTQEKVCDSGSCYKNLNGVVINYTFENYKQSVKTYSSRSDCKSSQTMETLSPLVFVDIPTTIEGRMCVVIKKYRVGRCDSECDNDQKNCPKPCNSCQGEISDFGCLFVIPGTETPHIVHPEIPVNTTPETTKIVPLTKPPTVTKPRECVYYQDSYIGKYTIGGLLTQRRLFDFYLKARLFFDSLNFIKTYSSNWSCGIDKMARVSLSNNIISLYEAYTIVIGSDEFNSSTLVQTVGEITSFYDLIEKSCKDLGFDFERALFIEVNKVTVENIKKALEVITEEKLKTIFRLLGNFVSSAGEKSENSKDPSIFYGWNQFMIQGALFPNQYNKETQEDKLGKLELDEAPPSGSQHSGSFHKMQKGQKYTLGGSSDQGIISKKVDFDNTEETFNPIYDNSNKKILKKFLDNEKIEQKTTNIYSQTRKDNKSNQSEINFLESQKDHSSQIVSFDKRSEANDNKNSIELDEEFLKNIWALINGENWKFSGWKKIRKGVNLKDNLLNNQAPRDLDEFDNNVIKNYMKKKEKKKKSYRKDYYPNYNKLFCRTTGCAPTGKGFNLPTERPPLTLLQVGWMTEVTCSQELSSLST
ncbi:hypothetical protein AYI68_g8290, partial [Smittium mucronatum]